MKLKEKWYAIRMPKRRIYTFFIILVASWFIISLIPEDIKNFIIDNNDFKILAFFATLLGLSVLLTLFEEIENKQQKIGLELSLSMKEQQLKKELKEKVSLCNKRMEQKLDTAILLRDIEEIKREIRDIQNQREGLFDSNGIFSK